MESAQTIRIDLKSGKKMYFASDFHLGLDTKMPSIQREKMLVKWLNTISKDAQALFLLGDVFDFWHEWHYVIPKGFVRFLGKLAELTDAGVEVYYFTGNHDIWAYDYLRSEIGCHIFRNPVELQTLAHKFYLAHGDGLGPGDLSYKILKKIFTNNLLQWFFARLHPNFALWFGNTWSTSRRSKEFAQPKKREFYGENEWLLQHSRNVLTTKNYDFFVYGHRHLAVSYNMPETNSVYINLGDWISLFTYGEYDGNSLIINNFSGSSDVQQDREEMRNATS